MNSRSTGGYRHPGYAASLQEFGEPRFLPACRGWILERPIPATPWRDAMGCYPIFTCQDWTRLHEDVAALRTDLVALSLVTDPFGNFSPADLQRAFERVTPYKEHFVLDLQQNPHDAVSAHHRRNARRAQQRVDVQLVSQPINLLDEWTALYDVLINRHNITGITAFSRRAFAQQLQVPGTVLLSAQADGETVGITWWYKSDYVAYYHLGAYSPSGYALMASFALFWAAIDYFKDHMRWLSLGAGAGATAAESGLTRFKRGWASDTRPVYFCSQILAPAQYQQLVDTNGVTRTDYFPAYRGKERTS